MATPSGTQAAVASPYPEGGDLPCCCVYGSGGLSPSLCFPCSLLHIGTIIRLCLTLSWNLKDVAEL